MKIELIDSLNDKLPVVHIVLSGKLAKDKFPDEALRKFVAQAFDSGKEMVQHQQLGQYYFFIKSIQKSDFSDYEKLRIKGNDIQRTLNTSGSESVIICNHTSDPNASLAIAEGAALGSYQFLKYFKDKAKKTNSVKSIKIIDAGLENGQVKELNVIVNATFLARDLVNEPLSFLTAVQFGKEIQNAGQKAGFKVKVLNKKQIEEEKMGGLLAVNRGSIDPPTFSILEYKPAKHVNKTPVVLVGKGVVFDTGGLSLKPTPGSMDEMKCDMAGGAAVTGALYAISANKLPVHVIGLVPATDNRPGMNAYVPQDIIQMHDGTTVEVLNTDAEGRMLLADALSYAKKYKPELVIDLATLTGAALRAVGSYATAAMGNAGEKWMQKLNSSGFDVFERCVEFPMWSEYGDEMKSDIADLKNLGGANAGHISAAKFLEHFTDYPWIHLDIAGPAYLGSASSYRPKGGTGVGVRLLYNFIKQNFAS